MNRNQCHNGCPRPCRCNCMAIVPEYGSMGRRYTEIQITVEFYNNVTHYTSIRIPEELFSFCSSNCPCNFSQQPWQTYPTPHSTFPQIRLELPSSMVVQLNSDQPLNLSLQSEQRNYTVVEYVERPPLSFVHGGQPTGRFNRALQPLWQCRIDGQGARRSMLSYSQSPNRDIYTAPTTFRSNRRGQPTNHDVPRRSPNASVVREQPSSNGDVRRVQPIKDSVPPGQETIKTVQRAEPVNEGIVPPGDQAEQETSEADLPDQSTLGDQCPTTPSGDREDQQPNGENIPDQPTTVIVGPTRITNGVVNESSGDIDATSTDREPNVTDQTEEPVTQGTVSCVTTASDVRNDRIFIDGDNVPDQSQFI